MRRVLLLVLALTAIPAFADRLIPFTANAVADQCCATLVSGGVETLALWMEGRDGNRSVYASLFGSTGSRTADRILIGSAGNNDSVSGAYNGADYLVVWRRSFSEGGAILARRLSNDGTPLDAAERILDAGPGIGTAHVGPHVASDGSNWLVVWQRGFPAAYGSPAGSIRAYGFRISTSGAALDVNPVLVWPDARDQFDPDVAWDGSAYVVAWQSVTHPFKSPESTWITTVRLSSALTSVGRNPIADVVGAEYHNYYWQPALENTGRLR